MIFLISPFSLPAIILLKTSGQWSKRHAVVASVRRSQQCVDVELRRLRVAEENSRVVIELNDDDGALDAIVKWILIAEATDPAPICFGKMLLDLFQS